MRYVSVAGVRTFAAPKVGRGNGARRQYAARRGSSPAGAERWRASGRSASPACRNQVPELRHRPQSKRTMRAAHAEAAGALPKFNTVPRPGTAGKRRCWPPASTPPRPWAKTGRASEGCRNGRSRRRSDACSPKGGDDDWGQAARQARAAAPPRARIAANDDAPSIGGLIFALQQKPSNRPFMVAAAGSGGWLAVGSLLAWAMLAPEIARSSFLDALASPIMIIVAATDLPSHRAVLVPRAAGVARAGAQAHVLGDDRGRGAAGRA